MYRIQIEGWREVQKEFEQLANNKRWQYMMKQAVHDMKREAKRLCPVDTGMLRDSIFMRKMGNMLYQIGFTVHYGIYNEYGWYGIPPIGDGDENPKFYKGGYRPFLRPAIWKSIKEHPKLLERWFNILKGP